MIDYYGEYHQAQQEETTPNLCPECNGSAYETTGATGYYDDYSDCQVCHGTGTIDQPYTERDLWINEVCEFTSRVNQGLDYWEDIHHA